MLHISATPSLFLEPSMTLTVVVHLAAFLLFTFILTAPFPFPFSSHPLSAGPWEKKASFYVDCLARCLLQTCCTMILTTCGCAPSPYACVPASHSVSVIPSIGDFKTQVVNGNSRPSYYPQWLRSEVLKILTLPTKSYVLRGSICLNVAKPAILLRSRRSADSDFELAIKILFLSTTSSNLVTKMISIILFQVNPHLDSSYFADHGLH